MLCRSPLTAQSARRNNGLATWRELKCSKQKMWTTRRFLLYISSTSPLAWSQLVVSNFFPRAIARTVDSNGSAFPRRRSPSPMPDSLALGTLASSGLSSTKHRCELVPTGPCRSTLEAQPHRSDRLVHHSRPIGQDHPAASWAWRATFHEDGRGAASGKRPRSISRGGDTSLAPTISRRLRCAFSRLGWSTRPAGLLAPR